jgi:hypothetical protein
VALIATTVAWAQTSVSTDSELRAAIQTDGANIIVTADIDLGNSTLDIGSGKTVTIDLNGHTLDRRLNSRGEGGGQVITVRSDATLNLSNGTLKGGWGGNGGGIANEGGSVNLRDIIITGCKGDDRGGGISNGTGGTLTMTGGAITNNICYDHCDTASGGGIFNAGGATMTLTDVTITGNETKLRSGGGICNYGTLNLNSCTIQNNTARFSGGGIWSINKNGFKMQGANIITDNIAGGVPCNIFLKARCLITLTGSITGSQIGVTLERVPETFTKEYGTHHHGVDPHTFFTCDRPEFNIVDFAAYEEELMVKNAVLPEGTVPYIERSWDSENKKVISTVKTLTTNIGFNNTPTSETQYKILSSSDSYVDLGTANSMLHEYYVVRDEEVSIQTLYIEGPNVHIILCDNAKLEVTNEINVRGDTTLYIHAQSAGSAMGKLTSGGGIGGNMSGNVGGNIVIHGGDFDLQGAYNCAAIGGHYNTGSNITIFDGRIYATGGGCAAGIGGGGMCDNYGNITIYDGTIEATGEAAIGGGQECLNGNLTIWGGAITARGQSESAGIGSSQYSGDYGAGTITVNGGYIRAYGDQYGAGIGGGDGKRGGTLNVNGGRVDAYGGTDAAGIGGGEGGNGGIVTINGGYVYAEGGWEYGAGIGGGQDGAGANVTISGGVVIAKAGTGGDENNHPAAIGAGYGSSSHGSLTLADNLGVFVTTNLYRSQKANRVSDCRNYQYVKINQCAHGNATFADNGSGISVGCPYCFASTMPYTFKANGNWDDGSNWFAGFMPHEGKDVAVKARATIPNNCIANVGHIDMQDGGSITIADGGQLFATNSIPATVEKSIPAGGWQALAPPVKDAPVSTLACGTYDLFRYDEPTATWENQKSHADFALRPGLGYIYRRADAMTAAFSGTTVAGRHTTALVRTPAAGDLAGFNLVGNPYPHALPFERAYYALNGDGSWTAYPQGGTLTVGEAVLVYTNANDEMLILSPEGIVNGSKKGYLPPLSKALCLGDCEPSNSDTQSPRHSTIALWDGDRWVIIGEGTLEAYDIMGRKIFSQEVSPLTSHLSPFTFPQTGVYILRLDGKSQKIVIR